MGVDARILVKVPGGTLTQEDVIRLGYELASTVGHDMFMISRGDPEWPFEQSGAIELVEPVAPDSDYLEYHPGLAGRVAYFQDGDPVVAREGEQFLTVNLMSRYYGEDYARGNWSGLRSVIEWFGFHMPEAEVWYGGDSSGMCVELMTPERMKAINDFFLSSGRKSYARRGDTGFDRFNGHKAPACGCSGVPMASCGGGRGQTFWYCDGCGAQVVTSAKTPGGVRLGRHEEMFAGSERLAGEGLA